MDTTQNKRKRTVDLGEVDLKLTLVRMTNRTLMELIQEDPYVDISMSHDLLHFSDRSIAQRVGVDVSLVREWIAKLKPKGVKKYKKGKVFYAFLSDLDERLAKRASQQVSH